MSVLSSGRLWARKQTFCCVCSVRSLFPTQAQFDFGACVYSGLFYCYSLSAAVPYRRLLSCDLSAKGETSKTDSLLNTELILHSLPLKPEALTHWPCLSPHPRSHVSFYIKWASMLLVLTLGKLPSRVFSCHPLSTLRQCLSPEHLIWHIYMNVLCLCINTECIVWGEGHTRTARFTRLYWKNQREWVWLVIWIWPQLMTNNEMIWVIITWNVITVMWWNDSHYAKSLETLITIGSILFRLHCIWKPSSACIFAFPVLCCVMFIWEIKCVTEYPQSHIWYSKDWKVCCHHFGRLEKPISPADVTTKSSGSA